MRLRKRTAWNPLFLGHAPHAISWWVHSTVKRIIQLIHISRFAQRHHANIPAKLSTFSTLTKYSLRHNRYIHFKIAVSTYYDAPSFEKVISSLVLFKSAYTALSTIALPLYRPSQCNTTFHLLIVPSGWGRIPFQQKMFVPLWRSSHPPT